MGPTELIQATAIARQYYLQNMAKTEIAKAHGLSRYKISRILNACVAQGIVRIEIGSTGIVDTELSERLRRRYDLRHALVVAGPFGDVDAQRAALGRGAAELLAEVITEDDVLGVAWGRTLDAMARQIHDLPSCQIVQLSGIAGAVRASSVDLIRQLSSVSHGLHFPIYAPLVVSDAATAAALRRQPGIQAAISRWKSITVAMIAVGSWDTDGSQLHAALAEADHRALASLNVTGEACSILFDADGRVLDSPLTQRTIAIPLEDLRRTPEVVAVAGGTPKIQAIGSLLRGRVATSVVTDSEVATRLLAEGSEPTAETPRRRRRASRPRG